MERERSGCRRIVLVTAILVAVWCVVTLFAIDRLVLHGRGHAAVVAGGQYITESIAALIFAILGAAFIVTLLQRRR